MGLHLTKEARIVYLV